MATWTGGSPTRREAYAGTQWEGVNPTTDDPRREQASLDPQCTIRSCLETDHEHRIVGVERQSVSLERVRQLTPWSVEGATTFRGPPTAVAVRESNAGLNATLSRTGAYSAHPPHMLAHHTPAADCPDCVAIEAARANSAVYGVQGRPQQQRNLQQSPHPPTQIQQQQPHPPSTKRSRHQRRQFDRHKAIEAQKQREEYQLKLIKQLYAELSAKSQVVSPPVPTTPMGLPQFSHKSEW